MACGRGRESHPVNDRESGESPQTAPGQSRVGESWSCESRRSSGLIGSLAPVRLIDSAAPVDSLKNSLDGSTGDNAGQRAQAIPDELLPAVPGLHFPPTGALIGIRMIPPEAPVSRLAQGAQKVKVQPPAALFDHLVDPLASSDLKIVPLLVGLGLLDSRAEDGGATRPRLLLKTHFQPGVVRRTPGRMSMYDPGDPEVIHSFAGDHQSRFRGVGPPQPYPGDTGLLQHERHSQSGKTGECTGEGASNAHHVISLPRRSSSRRRGAAPQGRPFPKGPSDGRSEL